MKKPDVLTALAALAQENRLDVFRLLVQAGPDGMAAGQVAQKLDLAPNTLTFHFDRLRDAGLVTVRRDGDAAVLALTEKFDAVRPAKLQANSSDVLVYIAQALGGGSAAKVMALALALSVIASTGVSIVILARMLYGMASHRVLPAILGNVNTRFATPAVASIVIGVILIVVTWVYLLASSISNAFTALIVAGVKR